ncbi:BCCT family transporter [Streptomyces kronopolitis]|uniref:BCCT family transporter n=1 Tax=Streptomyces kronopolitis TaxID=1612435 RepID=UPI003D99F668
MTGVGPRDAAQAMDTAMATAMFHRTLHPWAIYGAVGLAIAYSCFRRGRRQTISAVFTPLIGTRRVNGRCGRIIDILAIFATLFGSAASLGLGALRIGSGLTVLGWTDGVGTGLLVVIITVPTLAFILSAVSGIAKGVQLLSNITLVLAVTPAVVFVVGPTVLVLNLVPTSLASFLGMVIARISRGRTIRRFTGGVILVPSVVSLGVVRGVRRLGREAPGDRATGRLGHAGTPEGQLFDVLHRYPLATAMSILVMVLAGIFFVSGADAASLVMGTLSQKGTFEPTRPVVVFRGVVTGAVAAVMLLIGGGTGDALTGWQNPTILVAVPFMVVMIAMCGALPRDLRSDPLTVRDRQGAEAGGAGGGDREAGGDTGGDRDRDADRDCETGGDRYRETAEGRQPARGSGRGHPAMTKGPLHGCSAAEGPLAGPDGYFLKP